MGEWNRTGRVERKREWMDEGDGMADEGGGKMDRFIFI